ncbi:MAG TPA: retropepsin-like aspartic protease [Steroidobacteraceae bacterium]|nr:retropepsin-like aspartic protease [Steroidobacteraceae bacterium]
MNPLFPFRTRALRGLAALAATTLLALAATDPARAEVVQLHQEGGTYVVPVLLNHKVIRSFTIDSGSADVSIPEEVFTLLIREGTVAQQDMLDTRRYRLADGSEQTSRRFLIRSLRVGNVELRDVVASVVPEGGELLLGQSFLSRLSSWSIDNDRHTLALNGSAKAAATESAEAAASVSAAGTQPRPAVAPPSVLLPSVALPSGDSEFLKAFAYLVTGSNDSSEIKVVDRAECIVEVRPKGSVPASGASTPEQAMLLHFNNVDRSRSEIRASTDPPPRVEVTLRGVAVAENPAYPGSKAEAVHTIVLQSAAYDRVRSAWSYIYSHGCRGLNWSSRSAGHP